MKLTWYGTASIKITVGKTSLLFDPFFSLNPAIPPAHLEDFAKSTAIFITHGHFDHLMHLPTIWKQNTCLIHCGSTVCNALYRLGIPKNRIRTIAHGEELKFGSLTVRIYRSRHIKFDLPIIMKTFFNIRIIRYFKNFKIFLQANRAMPMGEVFAYEIIHKKTNILHFGSLAFDDSVQYPQNPTLLTVPYQGRSDLEKYAMSFILTFKPKAILLHHFDDTFPPISSAVNIETFIKNAKSMLPTVPVIVPNYGKPINLFESHAK
ncbi:MAG: MBL fold metallo-hydrolase [Spirochaetes bacterium]|nr:MBL fold metallo-hydrolase [Spirochaetota bacterium]